MQSSADKGDYKRQSSMGPENHRVLLLGMLWGSELRLEE